MDVIIKGSHPHQTSRSHFCQHHCLITASVPRVRCPEHGVKRIEVPWA
ncbi:MAG TPA: ISL3 family transposase, partial [Desulfobulbus sp.]|nr:ISL3 family transposase [Desulfobulbus sp.]